MKSTLTQMAVAAALAWGSLSQGIARELEIRHATEIEFETEHGRYYQLQSSTNMVDWHNVEDPIYGHGGHERRLRSTRPDNGPGHEYFRINVTDAPTNGFAPWSLKGISVELDDEPGGDVMKFTQENAGLDVSEGDSDPFTYSFVRSGNNEAKAELVYASNKVDQLTFAFTGPGVGTWSRDEYRDGKLKDHDAGPFRIVGINAAANTNSGTINPNVIIAPPVANPAPPTSLSKLVYYFQSSGVPDRYEFIDDRNGREVQGVVQEGQPTNGLVYTYTVLTPNTASLVLSFGYYGMGGDRYECDLTFTDGSAGHFVRRLYRRGVLKDTDSGAFSQNLQLNTGGSTGSTGGATTPSSWPPLVTPTAPPAAPASLTSMTYYVYTAQFPDQYRFVAGHYGYAMPGASADQELEVSEGGNVYMYTYTNHSATNATLVITYGYYNLGGDREEYDLNYVDGSTAIFNRRLYRGGVIYTNQSGIFSTNSVLPYAYNPGTSTNNPSSGDYNFVMSTGESLKFTNATAGQQIDDSNPTDFSYVLTSTGANTATLRVQFKADKWDDYTLNYTSATTGSFVRKQYDRNSLKDTDSGTFTSKPKTP